MCNPSAGAQAPAAPGASTQPPYNPNQGGQPATPAASCDAANAEFRAAATKHHQLVGEDDSGISDPEFEAAKAKYIEATEGCM